MTAKQFGLPDDFDDLPHFETSKASASTRAQSARTDKAFNIRSFADLAKEGRRRVAEAASSSSKKRAR